MKLTTIILLASLLQVSAASFGQKLNLKGNNLSFDQVFREIRKQTGYNVLIISDRLKSDAKTDVQFKDADLDQVMDQLLKGKALSYSIDKKTIVIKEAEPSFPVAVSAAHTPIDVTGRVVDDKGAPLVGATVRVKDGSKAVVTNENGEFLIKGVDDKAVLLVSYLGFKVMEIGAGKNLGTIRMEMSTADLTEVNVNTGYQTLPKERATGSFTVINNDLVNRRVSTNILDRLEGVASGIRFQTNTRTGEARISVRGRSTINSNTEPLIILDNFPYDGDLNNINPNDVENITILKDAAAASIWGSRAGNGVIVITTKKGKLNQRLTAEANANYTIGAKPDLFYNKSFISSSDYIDLQKFLYTNGQYTADLNSTRRVPIPEVVEILEKQRLGTLTADQANAQLDALRTKDVRNDFEKYIYRESQNQQYAINMRGGSDRATFALSAGYDKNMTNLIRNDYDRLTLNTINTYTFFKRLELTAGLNYVQTNTSNNNIGTSFFNNKAAAPYASLADENGNALAFAKDYRTSFIQSTGNGLLLDWLYRPLDEIKLADNRYSTNDMRVLTGAKFTFIPGLTGEIKYQWEKQTGLSRNLQSQDTYFTRNLINRFSVINGTTATRPIPLGGILDLDNNEMKSSRFRSQVNFNRAFGKHDFNGILGVETGRTRVNSNQNRLYGYKDEIATSATNLNYSIALPQYLSLNGSTAFIPTRAAVIGTADINASYFGNVGYTYNGKYTITGSARLDQSNLFGVDFNDKGTPLWSTGLMWNIAKEPFYKIDWLPYLRLRTTYGYTGNVNKTVAALLTLSYSPSSGPYGIPSVNSITNLPNDNLRWERNNTANLGLDFETKNKIITGSIEYYQKKSTDLIAPIPLASSTGVTTTNANVANMKTDGLDIELHSANIKGVIGWESDVLFSYNKEKVTKYFVNPSSSGATESDGYLTNTSAPVVGKPLYKIYGYKWAGLDAVNGDPQGYLNGKISKDYSLLTDRPIDSLHYFGSARPTIFGGLRNTFTWKGISLSMNITFKLGYYFRTPSVSYNAIYGSNTGLHQDYSRRWQKPGDESMTNVPSSVYPANVFRDIFYNYSEILVQKGDHIRIQDIQLSYNFRLSENVKNAINGLTIYTYINNIGLLWKSNKAGIDPDYVTGIRNPRTVAFGLKTNF